ncbi:MAG: TRAP transporter large permease subunit, partial [Alphaproteobacteria bacterium]
HLGIIFLVNLELGYLTPPVGMNVFFASHRFEQPLVHMYRCALPFLLILFLILLLVTYVPVLTLGLVGAE